MKQHVVDSMTQTNYDSGIDDDGHLDDGFEDGLEEDYLEGNENEMKNNTDDEFIVNNTIIKNKWW